MPRRAPQQRPRNGLGGFARTRQESAYPKLWSDFGWCPATNPYGVTTLIDNGGQGNHGQLTNFTPSTAWANPLTFDGVDDYVLIGNSSPLGFSGSVSEFSISAWLDLPSISVFRVIGKSTNSGSSSGWGMAVSNGNYIFVATRNAAGVGTGFFANGIPTLSGPHHFHVTWSSIRQTCEIFLDGSSRAITTNVATSWTIAANSIPVRLGAYEGGSGDGDGTTAGYAPGTLMDVAIWSRYVPQFATDLYKLGPGGIYTPRSRPMSAVSVLANITASRIVGSPIIGNQLIGSPIVQCGSSF